MPVVLLFLYAECATQETIRVTLAQMVHSETIVVYLVICAIVELRTVFYAVLLMMLELLLHALNAQMIPICSIMSAAHVVNLFLHALPAIFLLKAAIPVQKVLIERPVVNHAAHAPTWLRIAQPVLQ